MNMKKKCWPLGMDGFLMNYMVSGPVEEDYSNEKQDKNQLRYEMYLRSVIAEHTPVEEFGTMIAGEDSRLGQPWRYYYSYGSNFVDLSAFYSLMKRVRFDLTSSLVSPDERTVQAVLWSYSAVDVYCNGVLVGGLQQPVYKPIQKRELTLSLRTGENLLYLACENLGVRDSRSVAGLQLIGNTEGLFVTLPDEVCAEEAYRAEEFFNHLELREKELVFLQEAPEGAAFAYLPDREDLASANQPLQWNSLAGQTRASLLDGEEELLVRVQAPHIELTRWLERTEQIQPQYTKQPISFEENRELIFERIAQITSMNRGDGIGFPIVNLLARKKLGIEREQDEAYFLNMLDLIEKRVDCADFQLCGLIRYLHSYSISPRVEQRVKEVMCGFRYWMDMDGFDGMCFWSENHSLMFYSCAMLAGQRYPDAFFTRAQMQGLKLYQYGREKVLQWIADVEEGGFEEFLSSVYMCVTFAALLNVVDYADEEISARARAITDRMLEMLALHTYKNGFLAPMGRVYRDVLYPFRQGAMALMNLINPKLPYSLGEGWLGFWTNSGYQLPKGLPQLMEESIKRSYTTGNARIVLEKNEAYCLTSVQSPREPFVRWNNLTLQEHADISTHAFTKSFNERFHGTTCFRPGVYGYQQHMWYAGLDGEAVIFTNHPGAVSESGDLRPGFWHGNGVMPAIRQEDGCIGLIYVIPKEHPISFTHLYCPECRFDEVKKEDGWIYLKKGTGYLGLWCNVPLQEHNGTVFHCEQRAYAREAAYFCCAAGAAQCSSLEEFAAYARAQSPSYDSEKQCLTAKGLTLTYEACQDETQVM